MNRLPSKENAEPMAMLACKRTDKCFTDARKQLGFGMFR